MAVQLSLLLGLYTKAQTDTSKTITHVLYHRVKIEDEEKFNYMHH
jgi:hypothetical protein